MATRDGHKIGTELVEKYGWGWAENRDPEYFGDRWVIDPLTKEEMSPYDGKRVQDMRNDAKNYMEK